MRIVEIKSLPNGGHRNQFSPAAPTTLDGWAVIPQDMALPDSFPFVDIEAKIDKDTGLLTVTKMIEAKIPETPADNSEKISELKELLSKTDYAIVKIAEGAAKREDYTDLIEQREKWREEIRKLEQE